MSDRTAKTLNLDQFAARFIDRVAILGSAAACREQIAAFVKAGVTTPVLSPIAVGRAGVEAVLQAFAPRTAAGR